MNKFFISLIIFFLTIFFLNSEELLDLYYLKIEPYAVSSESSMAVDVGMDILERGGNAVDAAVAISYVLGVVQPYGSGIGGGGVMLIYPSKGTEPIVYDYLETAPAEEAGKFYDNKNIGIPGFVKGMEKVHDDLGTMDMGALIDPAIKYAEQGFTADNILHRIVASSKSKIYYEEPEIFFSNGKSIDSGTKIKQNRLAETLKKIKAEGSTAFYEGDIAREIVNADTGISYRDLKNYKVKIKKPVSGKYCGYDVISAPPPCSGASLIQMLKLAEDLGINQIQGKTDNIFLLSDIIQKVYENRAKYLSDPDFSESDIEQILSDANLNEIKSEILNRVIKKEKNQGESLIEDTTHFVVVDKDGMMVSCTNSLSSWFGSGEYVAGFFLNNHMKNFSTDPDSINFYKEGKKPRTFIAPTIIVKDGKPVLGIGAAGGSRIPEIMAQVIINILNNHFDPQYAVNMPRFYIVGNNIYKEIGCFEGEQKISNSVYNVIIENDNLKYGAVNCLLIDYTGSEVYGGADYRRGSVWKSDFVR